MDKTTPASVSSSAVEAPNEEVKYKGVRKRKRGKYVSEIRRPNSRERIWLGTYDSAEKAARAFDAAQYCLRGPQSNFNFPDNPPNIPLEGRRLSPERIEVVARQYANECNNIHHHGTIASQINSLISTVPDPAQPSDEYDYSWYNVACSFWEPGDMHMPPNLVQNNNGYGEDDDEDNGSGGLWNF